MAAQAAVSDPGKAAVKFLEKVRDGNVNLDPGGDTALTAQTVPRKRRQIEKRLRRLAQELGTGALEVGEVKLDENLAAVIVRRVGGFDLENLRVFPIALVKHDSEWEVAPLPASFENAGTGYAIALRNRIEQLEKWMLRQQVEDLEKLQSQTKEKMRGSIEARISASDVAKLDARGIGERFIAACAAADVPAVLGLLGGLGDPLPADWSARLRAAENAMKAGRAAPWPWHLLVTPDVARVLVNHEEDSLTGLFSVAFLDPNGIGRNPPRIEILHFNLTKSEAGLWRVDPPPSLLANKPTTDDELPPELDDNPDQELIRSFPAAWTALHPAAPQPTAELARQTWFSAIASGDFTAFLATVDLSGDPANATKSCLRAAREWWEIRGPAASALALPLAFQSLENSAAAIYQTLTPRDPDLVDLQPLYFTRSDAGWSWQSSPDKTTVSGHAAWRDPEMKRLSDIWQAQVLTACPIIAKDAALTAPDETEARKCVEDWLAAIRRGDTPAAISEIARLATPRSDFNALRNLGYEIATIQDSPIPSDVTATFLGDHFAAVAVKTRRADGSDVFPLYPVVRTGQGLRILAEIDLFASHARSRDFLNQDSLERLSEATTEDLKTDLSNLLTRHHTAFDSTSE